MRNIFIVIILLVSLCVSQNVYSVERNNEKHQDDVFSEISDGRKYICFELGITYRLKVYIAEGDSICDVSFYNGRGGSVSTTCPKTSILKWAFDNSENEIMNSVPATIDSNYNQPYVRLSLLKDSSQRVIVSSSEKISQSYSVQKTINKLTNHMFRIMFFHCIPMLQRLNNNKTNPDHK